MYVKNDHKQNTRGDFPCPVLEILQFKNWLRRKSVARK